MAFTHKFVLKQHTPIIHFQHEQVGATIRATEFKAKLDKFIIYQKTSIAGTENERLIAAKENPTLVQWLQRKTDAQHPSFDYQVSLCILQKHRELKEPFAIEQRYPGFFANMGESKDKYRFIYCDQIVLNIQSTSVKLLDYISTILSAFLLSTNFGTRQSKGFGSFYLLDSPDSLVKDLGSFPYAFDVDVSKERSEKQQIRQLFHVIDLFYKTLRSGINHGIYFKSMLWFYLKKQDPSIQWDKKTIKQQFLRIKEDRQKAKLKNLKDLDSPLFHEAGRKQTVGNHETHLLWRDLFGLSTNEDWGKYYNYAQL